MHTFPPQFFRKPRRGLPQPGRGGGGDLGAQDDTVAEGQNKVLQTKTTQKERFPQKNL